MTGECCVPQGPCHLLCHHPELHYMPPAGTWVTLGEALHALLPTYFPAAPCGPPGPCSPADSAQGVGDPAPSQPADAVQGGGEIATSQPTGQRGGVSATQQPTGAGQGNGAKATEQATSSEQGGGHAVGEVVADQPAVQHADGEGDTLAEPQQAGVQEGSSSAGQAEPGAAGGKTGGAAGSSGATQEPPSPPADSSLQTVAVLPPRQAPHAALLTLPLTLPLLLPPLTATTVLDSPHRPVPVAVSHAAVSHAEQRPNQPGQGSEGLPGSTLQEATQGVGALGLAGQGMRFPGSADEGGQLKKPCSPGASQGGLEQFSSLPTVLACGVEAPLDMPLAWLHAQLHAPDYFLYIIVRAG